MKIFCSGIGGIGLSAYAALQHANGHTVLGSDRAHSVLIDDLRSQGITVFLEQDPANIPSDCDLFVYSEAIPADAPERTRAQELGIAQRSYFAALGDLSEALTVIAVCGTHGKSSTTAMATRVLMDAHQDPTVVVGTKLHELGERNWRKGQSALFLLEACEYRHSFYFLHPDIVLMTNVDGDHFDFYPSHEAYEQAFVEFLQRLPSNGVVITHARDEGCMRVASQCDRRIIDADTLALPYVGTPGRHMQQNAQLVLVLAEQLSLDSKQTQASLAAYKGSWRRMEVKGEFGAGVTVIDDYGHHPAEVRATLLALCEAYPGRRLVCVFQPHTHDRTLKLYDDFLTAFTSADSLILADVYEARKDIEVARVDIHQFTKDIAAKSRIECLYGGSLEAIEQKLHKEFLRPGDVLVCMGAGTITTLATSLVS